MAVPPPVVSQPAAELVGGGNNAKYVKECTELFLGNKGIEKLRGFEPFVNLESLWLNSNNLKKLNNLDANFRIKAVYAQDNQICTLKGSLEKFRFLEMLDLSNNQLRNLEKQLKALADFKFLKNLNLKGNPLCEEPDYRLLTIYAVPSLQVLDQHVVTPAERLKAKGLIGEDVATLTVAFMRRAPQYDPKWDAKVSERSVLEQELSKEAGALQDKLRHEAYMRDRALYMSDPHPAPVRGKGLPPNAGTMRAMQQWQQQSDQQLQQQKQHSGSGMLGRTTGQETATSSSGQGQGQGHVQGHGQGQYQGQHIQRRSTAGVPVPCLSLSTSNTQSPVRLGGGAASTSGSRHASPVLGMVTLQSHLQPGQDPYMARDKLVLYSLRPGQNEMSMISTTLLQQPSTGTIRFEQDKYETFVRTKAAGQGNWQLGKKVVKI